MIPLSVEDACFPGLKVVKDTRFIDKSYVPFIEVRLLYLSRRKRIFFTGGSQGCIVVLRLRLLLPYA